MTGLLFEGRHVTAHFVHQLGVVLLDQLPLGTLKLAKESVILLELAASRRDRPVLLTTRGLGLGRLIQTVVDLLDIFAETVSQRLVGLNSVASHAYPMMFFLL